MCGETYVRHVCVLRHLELATTNVQVVQTMGARVQLMQCWQVPTPDPNEEAVRLGGPGLFSRGFCGAGEVFGVSLRWPGGFSGST